MFNNAIFNLHRVSRLKLLAYLEKATPEQLALIPEGFHNNVLWNIAHCVVTQQLLCYEKAGLTPLVSKDLIDKYKKGTYPNGHIPSAEEIASLMELLLSTQEQLEADYKAGKFKDFTPYTSSYGFTLNNIEDAIVFNNTHEGMHVGVIIALNYFL